MNTQYVKHQRHVDKLEKQLGDNSTELAMRQKQAHKQAKIQTVAQKNVDAFQDEINQIKDKMEKENEASSRMDENIQVI
jgi:hypothetical protein